MSPTPDAKHTTSSAISRFTKDVRALSKLATSRRHAGLTLFEYPFDLALLTMSSIYRESRMQYLELGGRFAPRVSSVMRSLSAQDLFENEIDYSPVATELLWFAESSKEVFDPLEQILALERFNGISVFHEQNHRILWRFLPPAPKGARELSRYLNFAESLVVMLDLALADQVGPRLAPALERMKVLYRAGRVSKKWASSKVAYRNYLVAAQFATYLILELVHPDDILSAVDYVFPGQKAMNRDAVDRAFDINELFTRVTNPEWQKRYSKSARLKLAKIHRGSDEMSLDLPKDPLDFDTNEFAYTRDVLDLFRI